MVTDLLSERKAANTTDTVVKEAVNQWTQLSTKRSKNKPELQKYMRICSHRTPPDIPDMYKHVACSFELHKLHLFSVVCVSILCFSFVPLHNFRGSMVVSAEAGFKIEFLYSLPWLCCFFSLFFSLCFFLFLSSFLSWWQSPKHEINFSSWERMTLACGVCDLETNG